MSTRGGRGSPSVGPLPGAGLLLPVYCPVLVYYCPVLVYYSPVLSPVASLPSRWLVRCPSVEFPARAPR